MTMTTYYNEDNQRHSRCHPGTQPSGPKNSITNISNLFKDTRDTRYKSTCGAKRHSRCHPGTQPSGLQEIITNLFKDTGDTRDTRALVVLK